MIKKLLLKPLAIGIIGLLVYLMGYVAFCFVKFEFLDLSVESLRLFFLPFFVSLFFEISEFLIKLFD